MEERWREPAALAEQYAGMLYRLAYARTGSRADAEDVMQEVFVRLLRPPSTGWRCICTTMRS